MRPERRLWYSSTAVAANGNRTEPPGNCLRTNFGAVWVVSLYGVEDSAYTYAVSNLHFDDGPAPAWTIHIAKDFGSWRVTRVQ